MSVDNHEALNQSPDRKDSKIPDLMSPCAFGRILTPNFYKLPPEILDQPPTNDQLGYVAPSHIKEGLFVGGDTAIGGLAWNPAEYNSMARFPRAFGRAVLVRTAQSRALDWSQDRRDDAMKRSRSHAYAHKNLTMRAMVDGYESESGWLLALRKEMETPGWAHRKLNEMLVLATNTWQISFKNMLEVAADQYEWSNKMRGDADKLLIHRLFYAPQKSKLKYWKLMTDLAIEYNQAKNTVIQQKIRQTEPDR